MVLVQNEYNNTLVGVLRTKITFITHSSPSCQDTPHSGDKAFKGKENPWF